MIGPDNSLRAIDSELLATLEWLVELEESHADADLLEGTREAVQEYKGQLAKKVDRFAGLALQLRDEIDAGEREIKRITARIKQAETIEARLKGIAAEVLEAQPQPAKSPKQLRGTLHTLTLRRNSQDKLEIAVPAVVPDELAILRGWVNAAMWEQFVECGRAHGLYLDERGFQFTREPSNTLIREELAKPCEVCEGRGGFPVSADQFEPCDSCGGTGTRGVPGCRIGPRGHHVKIS